MDRFFYFSIRSWLAFLMMLCGTTRAFAGNLYVPHIFSGEENTLRITNPTGDTVAIEAYFLTPKRDLQEPIYFYVPASETKEFDLNYLDPDAVSVRMHVLPELETQLRFELLYSVSGDTFSLNPVKNTPLSYCYISVN